MWTFQIRRGVEVPQRQDDDGAGRRREHEAVRQREGLERGPVAVLRRSRRLGARQVHGRRSGSSRRSACSRTCSARRRYQAIIQPAAIAAKPGTWVKSGMIGTGPFRLRRYVDKRSAELVSEPQLLGRTRAARRESGSRSTRAARRWCSRCVRGRSTLRCSCHRRRPGRSRATRSTPTTPCRPRPPAGVHANGRGTVPGCAGASCGRARDQPPTGDRAGDARRGAGRQRQPVLAGLRLQRPHHAAAHAEPRTGESVC